MTFADRQYNRTVAYGQPVAHAVTALLIANGAVFAVQLFLYVAAPRASEVFEKLFILTPALALGQLCIWQFVTYSFLHTLADPFHIAFNLLVLWMFGREVEFAVGRRRFLILYFAAAVAGGVCMIPWFYGSTLGASGAVFGVMAVYARLFPSRIVYFFFLVPFRVKTLVLLLVSIDVLYAVVGGGNVAHLAHVGGFLVGWFFLPVESAVQGAQARGALRRELAQEEEGAEIRAQVDELLAKVAREGLGSLSESERGFLRRASRHFRP